MPSTLLPDLGYELDGFTFGTDTPYIVTDVDYGSISITSSDAPLPRADGIRFGRDYRTNRTITFEIVVAQSPHQNGARALDLLADLETAWIGDVSRSTPGAVSKLRMKRNGRARCVYGRPRDFATQSERSKGGWVYATAAFTTVDPHFYDDNESLNSVSIVPVEGGGIISPLFDPITTRAISYGPGDITVGGTVPCWPVFVIRGPINMPTVRVVGEWSFTLPSVNLLYDQQIIVDTRPWVRSIRLTNGRNLAGALNPGAPRLSQMRLSPGPHEVILSGYDETGTSQMTIAWRDTFASY